MVKPLGKRYWKLLAIQSYRDRGEARSVARRMMAERDELKEALAEMDKRYDSLKVVLKEDRTMLASDNAELRRKLKNVEWVSLTDGGLEGENSLCCPSCWSWKRKGHSPDCLIQKVLVSHSKNPPESVMGDAK